MKTASAELKKHKGSRGGDEPGMGGIRLVFLPGLDGTWEGGQPTREGQEGSGGEVSIRRREGGINQVGADDALPPQHLGRHLAVAAGRWSPHLLLSTSPGLSKFGTSWGQVIRAQVSTTNGSSQRVGALALSDPKYSFERGGQQHSS